MKTMYGLTLLEVILAGFILTSVTLFTLVLLLEQRGTLHHMRDQMVTQHLLKTVEEQLQAAVDASEREGVLQRWRIIATQLLPYSTIRFQCGQKEGMLCITPKNITTKNSEPLCTRVILAVSRY